VGSYSREAERHVHRVPSLKLPGVAKIQVCLPWQRDLVGMLDRFARIWSIVITKLHGRRLSRLTKNVIIVFTERRGYYARFWKGNILCINLRDLLGQGDKAPGIIIHELGHRIWFHIAKTRTRARWAADHSARKKLDSEGASFVSSYAQRNALEDHAEGFRARVEGTLKTRARQRYERLGPTTRTIRARFVA
jgi:hypothetical protein